MPVTAAPLRVLVVDDDYRVAGIHAAYVDADCRVSSSSVRPTRRARRAIWPLGCSPSWC